MMCSGPDEGGGAKTRNAAAIIGALRAASTFFAAMAAATDL